MSIPMDIDDNQTGSPECLMETPWGHVEHSKVHHVQYKVRNTHQLVDLDDCGGYEPTMVLMSQIPKSMVRALVKVF